VFKPAAENMWFFWVKKEFYFPNWHFERTVMEKRPVRTISTKEPLEKTIKMVKIIMV
jgi:hypothetical protein